VRGEGCGDAAAQGVAEEGEVGPGVGGGGEGEEDLGGVEAGVVGEIEGGGGVAAAEEVCEGGVSWPG